MDLKQINADNVKNLRPVCMYQAPENSTAQANPIVYQNTMYVTTGHLTIALNATDCSVRWMSKWIPKRAEAMPENRGAAIGSGLVVRGTADGYLIALDSRNWGAPMATSDCRSSKRLLLHHASAYLR